MRGRNAPGPDGGKFCKNICSAVDGPNIFKKTFAQPKLVFHKTFANIYSFSPFPCGHGSKGEEKCGHMYVLGFSFPSIWLFQA